MSIPGTQGSLVHALRDLAREYEGVGPNTADRERHYGLLTGAADEIENLRESLRLMLQYGIDEDDQVWIAAQPSGVGRAADTLGIDAMFVRDEADRNAAIDAKLADNEIERGRLR